MVNLYGCINIGIRKHDLPKNIYVIGTTLRGCFFIHQNINPKEEK